MNIIYETLIIIVIAIFYSFYGALILCYGKDEHHYIVYQGVEKENYVLKKSRFILLPVLAITRNWKTGIVRKDTFWGLISTYIYFLCFFITDLIFYFVTRSDMIIAQPLVFVIPVAVPWIALLLLRIIFILINNKMRKNNTNKS